jgi:hypothetical protein
MARTTAALGLKQLQLHALRSRRLPVLALPGAVSATSAASRLLVSVLSILTAAQGHSDDSSLISSTLSLVDLCLCLQPDGAVLLRECASLPAAHAAAIPSSLTSSLFLAELTMPARAQDERSALSLLLRGLSALPRQPLETFTLLSADSSIPQGQGIAPVSHSAAIALLRKALQMRPWRLEAVSATSTLVRMEAIGTATSDKQRVCPSKDLLPSKGGSLAAKETDIVVQQAGSYASSGVMPLRAVCLALNHIGVHLVFFEL